MLPKFFFGALCAGVLFVAASSNASAAEITFAGYTNGCFGAACALPTTAAPQTATVNELFFTNATFTGTSVGGVLNPVLGTFSLNPQGTDDYTGSVFTLQVTFTLPSVISGSSGVFVANLTGTASSAPGQCPGNNNDCANLTINFSQAPLPYTYSNATANGEFSLSVDDVVFNFAGLASRSSAVASIQGHIFDAVERTGSAGGPQALVPAPEPGSMILLGSGIAALAVTRLRRRKQQN